ncbi:unnamed protein product, partial [Effrenium voratum]
DEHSHDMTEVEIMLWDVEVAAAPLSAFGDTATGCLKNNDDYKTENCMSEAECALRCLTTKDCASFDYRARFATCFMSRTSFSKCSSCQDQGYPDCRYYERRTEKTPRAAVQKTISYFYTYRSDLTPDIQLIYTLPGTQNLQAQLQGDSGCNSNHSDLGSGNNDCCSSNSLCGVNEGVCSSSEDCVGQLTCIPYSCSWSSNSNDELKDSCCVLQGLDGAYAQQDALWMPGDAVYLRVSGLQDFDALLADPTAGSTKVSFEGVDCPLQRSRYFAGEDWLELGCTLGEVPGGFAAFPKLRSLESGFASEETQWINLPLVLDSVDATAEISASSLGGGWTLTVNGQGFAPPPNASGDTFVEVTVCGKPCEVVSGTYTSVDCVVPNVTTPEVLAGASDAIVLPAPRVISRDAGLVSTAFPVCFHGVGDSHYEVGHPTCAAVFNDDPEIVGGTTGTNCHVGLDFGEFTNARVERIRWHPLYDVLEADQYINSKLQVGSLSASQPCDELSYGWRGVNYRGCQDVSEKGNPCIDWDSKPTGQAKKAVGQDSLSDSFPELKGHNFCRNPLPGSNPAGIWCLTKRGKEYCNPKMPKIDWTDVATFKVTPKMLWNEVVLSPAVVGRFVRFSSPTGNCQLTEMQVIGQMVAPSETCQVAVRNVRTTSGPGLHMELGRTVWRGGLHPLQEYSQAFTPWVTSSSENATVTFSLAKTPTVTGISPSNGTARGGTLVTISGENFGSAWAAADLNDSAGALWVLWMATRLTKRRLAEAAWPKRRAIRVPLPQGRGGVMQPEAGDTAAPIISYWYVGENNWNICLQQMAQTFRDVHSEFSGQWSDEQRLVQETRLEKVQDQMFDKTGGRVGKEYNPHSRTAHAFSHL